LISGRKKTQKKGSKVPAYIVTFSDMVTLLLTFFVMLLALSSVRDAELYKTGRDSFLESIQDFGIGILFGSSNKPDFGHRKVKYFIEDYDEIYDGRTIDAKEEELRRLFDKVNRSARTLPLHLQAKKINFSVADIRFAAGAASLNDSAKKFLTDFSQGLQQAWAPKRKESRSGNRSDTAAVKLYILGLARSEADEQKIWLLSAQRAQAVADFLKSTFPQKYAWPIYAWGAGPGGKWVEQNSPAYRNSQILIAVLRAR